MTDGQTGLMNQLADPGLFERGDPVDLPRMAPSVRIDHRGSPTVRDAVPLGSASDGLLRLTVKQTGHVGAEGADETVVGELVSLLLRPDPQSRVDEHLGGLLGRGWAVEQLYLRLFQPAARRLGELWVDDFCTFVDVTLAMSTLQNLLRQLAPRFLRAGRAPGMTRTMLLATLGDDQHTFGVAMTAEFFRRSGWNVSTLAAENDEALAGRLGRDGNVVVGFSVSRIDQLSELATAIRRVRRTGRDRVAGILVGGPLLATHPDWARKIDADAACFDARHAVSEAEALAASGGDRG